MRFEVLRETNFPFEMLVYGKLHGDTSEVTTVFIYSLTESKMYVYLNVVLI